MNLHLPDEIVKEAALTEEGCLVELAVQLYASRRLPLARALELCSLNRRRFEEELARRNVSLYRIEDLHADVAALAELEGLDRRQ